VIPTKAPDGAPPQPRAGAERLAPRPTHAGGAATLSYDEYRRRRYFPQLDGLRAISVVLVITVHMHDRVWLWLAGEHGVTIFFVLSGFLITTLALREEERQGRVDLRGFYVRRIFRLFPAYYAVLGLYCVLILVLGVNGEESGPFRRALPYYLFYLQEVPTITRGLNGPRAPLSHSWSLGIEEKFYLVWPLLAFVALASHHRRRAGVAAALGVAFAITPLFGLHERLLFPYYPIVVGCLCALVMHRPAGFRQCAQLARPGTAVAVAASFAALHLATARMPALAYLYPIGAAALMISVVAGEHAVTRALRTRALVFVGTISYGIYLVHVLCLNAAEELFRPGSGRFAVSAAAFVTAVLASIAAAYLLARTIEWPLRDLGRALSRRPAGRPGREPAVEASTP
jgi:peptidoglycan/LPS O-acetylase OafA/YrhL